jgi:hypothetical protein
MVRFVIVVKHSSNRDLVLTGKQIKVYGETSADKTQLLLVQDIYHLPQSISILVPGNEDNEKVYVCVGIENKVDDEVIYTSKKKGFDILTLSIRHVIYEMTCRTQTKYFAFCRLLERRISYDVFRIQSVHHKWLSLKQQVLVFSYVLQ